MRTTVTSNACCLTALVWRCSRASLTFCDKALTALPESHNRTRGSLQAFERMQSTSKACAGSGIPFGFIFTLTQYNVNEIDWAVRFAVEQGAKLFQIIRWRRSRQSCGFTCGLKARRSGNLLTAFLSRTNRSRNTRIVSLCSSISFTGSHDQAPGPFYAQEVTGNPVLSNV